MIVVDTSALMAIVLDEAEAETCKDAIARASSIAISAATLSKALVVADRRARGAGMRALLRDLDFEVVAFTRDAAFAVADAYTRWGKGVHPAGLNWGDCFSYVLAKQRGCPLLCVGKDFSQTDVMIA